jgi:hypothetical protein
MDVRVGGEVEAWCTTCRIMKDQVVVAMMGTVPARVECLGCGKQHNYRASPPGEGGAKKPTGARAAAKAAAAATATSQAAAAEAELLQKLAAGEANARTYSPNETYALGDCVRHPTFGVGLVVALPAAQKVELAFKSGRKLLVHDRGGAVAPTLERPPTRSDDDKPTPPSDAPPPKS